MTNKLTLELDKRSIQGRKVKQLRRQGIVPANIFGKKIDSEAVQISEKEFEKIFEEAGETTIIYATIKGEETKRPVLVSATQVHPVSGDYLHIDFHQVDLTQKVTATVPLVLAGEAPAVDDLGAILVQMLDEIEVEALPTDLPHELSVDISGLKAFGDAIFIKDIKVDTSKVEVKNDPEEMVAQVEEPKAEEEVVPEATEAEAAPVEEAPKEEKAE